MHDGIRRNLERWETLPAEGDWSMRALIGRLATVYLIGVLVELVPAIGALWNGARVPLFFAALEAEMPNALA